MEAITTYEIAKVLYKSDKTSIFLAANQANGTFVVKTTTNPYPSLEEIRRFEREYEISVLAQHENVVKILGFANQGNTLALFEEYIEGVTLQKFIQQEKPPIQKLLQIAIKASETLESLHQKNIIHKDINSNNLLINTQTDSLKIIDFDIATTLAQEKSEISNVNVLEGTLAYISPEQTGRMNRSLDYRTDLYSLGVLLYEMFTGSLPFENTDPMELIHAHIAIMPQAPHLLNKDIPAILSRIILKLLAKNAEERYQSAKGLSNDLKICLKYLQSVTQETSETFALGQQDISDRFQVPEKLYGREAEKKQLLQWFDDAYQAAQVRMVMVKGYSGIGKSGLIQEIQKPITQQKGYYIKGKFEQFQRNTPYLALIQAFYELLEYLLTEPEAKLEQWKNALIAALEGNGQVLIDVIPNLELIIGKQPAVELLPPTETLNRFNYTFERFIKVFTQKEHPIVLILDDLQWADTATLQLLETLLKNNESQYLFIIGSYRNNEVDDSHPLALMLKNLNQTTTIPEIILQNLNLENVQEMTADTLKVSREAVQELAGLIYDKTQGNPFFVNQFLSSLYEDKLLNFDYQKQLWTWEVSQIIAKNITDNVVELLVRKIEKLPQETTELLKIASAFSNYFDLRSLQAITNTSMRSMEKTLNIALQERLILRAESGYKFQHDRIQQAAYTLLKDEERQEVHLKIGENLRKSFKDEETFEKNLFTIVNQFNQATQIITGEQVQALKMLNLRAAQKAKNANAYDIALDYLQKILALLAENIWETNYDFALALHNELIDVHYLNGNFETSESFAEITIEKAKDNIAKAEVYYRLITQRTLKADFGGAVAFGKTGLKLLGFEIPENEQLQAGIGAGFGAVAQHLGERHILDVVYAPDAQEAQDIMIAKLLVNMAPPAYFSDPNLWTFIIVQATAFGLEKGNVPELSTAYSSYGILCGLVFSDYKAGYYYGELAYKLTEKYHNLSQRCNTCFVQSVFLIMPVKPAKEILSVAKEGIQTGFQVGELQYVSNIAGNMPNAYFTAGASMESILAQCDTNLHITTKYKNTPASDWILSYYVLANELGEPQKSILGIATESDAIFERIQTNKTLNAIFQFLLLKAVSSFVKQDLNTAINSIEEAEKLLPFNVGTQISLVFQFYAALIFAKVIEEDPQKQEALMPKVLQYLEKIKLLSQTSPENFSNKRSLIEAVIALIKQDKLKAMDLFEEALQYSRQNAFLLEEAITVDLMGQFYEKIQKPTIAQLYWQKAHQAYKVWGASQKVTQLEKKHSFLLRGESSLSINKTTKATLSTTTTGRTTQFSEKLDFTTIVKASQMLSEDVVLSSLLEKMMRILLENSGAQKGFLFLVKNNADLYLEAELDTAENKVIVLQSISIREINKKKYVVSDEIVNYVGRTKKNVVLNNATQEGQFMHTPYVKAVKPLSILCIPLLKTGKLVGVLYLENNISKGAFTEERLEVLNILSSQIAISVENSLLYENLEEKVRERTQQLNKAYQEIKQQNENITDSISYGKRIQEAILPDVENILTALPEAFVFFKPRDIVSGDFYWFAQKENKTIIIAADCTGHGVPGAFMSMIGNDLLSEIIEVRGLLSPSQILMEADKGIQKVLKQEQNQNRDGMDLALCIWDSNTRKLSFAGARNPLVMIQDNNLTVVKGNKFSIGGELRKKQHFFDEHHFTIDKPTNFYLYSDGFQDQFGGVEDKKFMKNNFQNLLLQIHKEEMPKQKEILSQALQEWQGKHLQTDDVLVIGFKIS